MTSNPTADWKRHSSLRLGQSAGDLIVTVVPFGRYNRRIRAMGIRSQPVAARSQGQNGPVERLIGSIRRECLDDKICVPTRRDCVVFSRSNQQF
jgi:hypothetical protein